MTNHDIIFSRQNGKISHLSRDIILYSIDIPRVAHEGFPNDLFVDVADNYMKYLKGLAERTLIPAYEKMRSEGARTRDIKKELGIPLGAFLSWRYSNIGERYLSLRCETRLVFSDTEKIFTLKPVTFDLENMTVAKVSDFATHTILRKYSFFLKGKNLYVFDKGRVLADSLDSAEQKMGVRIRKMNKNSMQNL